MQPKHAKARPTRLRCVRYARVHVDPLSTAVGFQKRVDAHRSPDARNSQSNTAAETRKQKLRRPGGWVGRIRRRPAGCGCGKLASVWSSHVWLCRLSLVRSVVRSIGRSIVVVREHALSSSSSHGISAAQDEIEAHKRTRHVAPLFFVVDNLFVHVATRYARQQQQYTRVHTYPYAYEAS